MPQDNRLFKGTLKENLLVGKTDISDEQLRNIAIQTGLINIVTNHPNGFELPIFEGGLGLSGGQKQLVSLTRMILMKPTIWLMDEPTASMDGELENRAIRIIFSTIKPTDTVIIVTHKPTMLATVNKVIVMNNGQVAIAGSKEEVLAKLTPQQPITK
jgi:ATP-binding cassette subfamily C protein LapB